MGGLTTEPANLEGRERTVTLSELIDQAIFKMAGNQEFALFHDEGIWVAEIGNPSPAVRLGESVGKFVGSANTPHGAVEQLIIALEDFS